MSPPYPDTLFKTDFEYNDGLPYLNKETLATIISPYPDTMFVSNGIDLLYFQNGKVLPLGCGIHSKIKKLKLSKSLKSISQYSFTYSQIEQVKLSDNCTYKSTSFPVGCTIIGGVLSE